MILRHLEQVGRELIKLLIAENEGLSQLVRGRRFDIKGGIFLLGVLVSGLAIPGRGLAVPWRE